MKIKKIEVSHLDGRHIRYEDIAFLKDQYRHLYSREPSDFEIIQLLVFKSSQHLYKFVQVEE